MLYLWPRWLDSHRNEWYHGAAKENHHLKAPSLSHHEQKAASHHPPTTKPIRHPTFTTELTPTPHPSTSTTTSPPAHRGNPVKWPLPNPTSSNLTPVHHPTSFDHHPTTIPTSSHPTHTTDVSVHHLYHMIQSLSTMLNLYPTCETQPDWHVNYSMWRVLPPFLPSEQPPNKLTIWSEMRHWQIMPIPHR